MDSATQIVGCVNLKVDKTTGADTFFPGICAFRITKSGLTLVSRLDLEDLEFSKTIECIRRVDKDDIFASATECRLILTRFTNQTFQKLKFVELGEGITPYFVMRENSFWIDACTQSFCYKFYFYDVVEGVFVAAEFIDQANP